MGERVPKVYVPLTEFEADALERFLGFHLAEGSTRLYFSHGERAALHRSLGRLLKATKRKGWR